MESKSCIFVCNAEDGYLDDSFNFESSMRLIPLESQNLILRKRLPKLQRMALVNRLLQIYGCSKISGLKSGQLKFTRGQFGKPKLEGNGNIEFSMSNGEQSCVMVTQQTEVGIDIASTMDCERWDEGYLHTFQDVFTDEELAALKASSSHRDELFTLYWSMKESYTKLIGTGLNTNIKAIDIGVISTPLSEHETMTTARSINGKPVIFSSRWINNHEIVTTCTFLKSSLPVASGLYELIAVSTCDLVGYLSE